MPPAASVIVAAYNNVPALIRSLYGYEAQDRGDFEVLIADDGSEPGQVALLESYLASTPLRIRHLWQEDRGFNKCAALNRAIVAAGADYLIFTDADVIPRRDFVGAHLRLARPGRYLSGGSHLNLPETVTRDLRPDDIRSQRCFDVRWLAARGCRSWKLHDRLATPRPLVGLKNLLTWRTGAFNGSNASVWKTDALRVNGFDESFGYGGLDRDFGCRLTNAGVGSRRHSYSLVALHQDHPRPYRDPSSVKANKARWRARYRRGLTWVEDGIRKETESLPAERPGKAGAPPRPPGDPR